MTYIIRLWIVRVRPNGKPLSLIRVETRYAAKEIIGQHHYTSGGKNGYPQKIVRPWRRLPDLPRKRRFLCNDASPVIVQIFDLVHVGYSYLGIPLRILDGDVPLNPVSQKHYKTLRRPHTLALPPGARLGSMRQTSLPEERCSSRPSLAIR